MKKRPPKGAANLFGAVTAFTAPVAFWWHLVSHGWTPLHPTDLFPSMVFSAVAVLVVGVITTLAIGAAAWLFNIPDERAEQTEG